MGEALFKPEPKEKYSYADYLTWPDEYRVELINGVIWDMSPAPVTKHQKISLALTLAIGNFLKGKSCELYIAPFDVRLVHADQADDQDIYITVQPDLSVICDNSKIDEKGCLGAPDLVVEILSPSTSYKDETEKLSLYEEYGVKEYWIVNPDRKTVQVFLHNAEEYNKPIYYKADEIIESAVLSGFMIRLEEIFRT